MAVVLPWKVTASPRHVSLKMAILAIAPVLVSVMPGAAVADPAPTLLWRHQVGQGGYEYASTVTADAAGNIIVAGPTNGPFAGPNKGGTDIFMALYRPDGTLRWKRKLATTASDGEPRAALDGSGNVVIASSTEGSAGQSNNGRTDALVVRLAPDGTTRWRRQAGTPRYDIVAAVAASGSGEVVIAGQTEGRLAGTNKGGIDTFVIKYAATGAEQWRRQPGAPGNDEAAAVAIDTAGNVVIAGIMDSGAPADGFVIKYAANGTELWRKQLGTTAFDRVSHVVIDDEGNVIVAGSTQGSLGGPNNGDQDVFVAVYAPDGELQWVRQPGTASYELSFGLGIDPDGNIVLAYQRHEDLHGEDFTVFAVYSPGGNLLATYELPPANDSPNVFAVDGAGNAILAGFASGVPDGDGFVAKYAPLAP